ncbi:unnamed protein product [Allacma fusca]|uniref:Uncharacterized protein n=1 Tax=Allacma fusca TaxID=39272 RepID=A0A8J2P469_9HEXA|nr:unnamed protein product [Allacma fusca]
MSSNHRTKAKVVAIFSLTVLSVVPLIALGTWVFFTSRVVQDFSDYTSSPDGQELLGLWIIIAVAAGLEGILAIILLFALRQESFTKVRIWFLVQSLYLAAITMIFLVGLTSASPIVPALVLIFLVTSIKSVSLWVVSQLVDDMKANNGQEARLIQSSAPSTSSAVQNQSQGYSSMGTTE